MVVDPAALDKLGEQRAVEAAWGAVVNVLDARLLTQLRVAQAGGEALVAAQRGLTFEQQRKPFGVRLAASPVATMSAKALTMPWRPRALRRSRVGWVARDGLLSADVGVQHRRIVRGALMSGTPTEVVGEDRPDQAIGARADVDRPRSRGVQSLAPIGGSEPADAEAGAEALLGVRALVENEVVQCAGRPPNGGVLIRIRAMVQPA
ncbi:hypothetical protein GGD62_007659 [Bradyrhizobium sp. ERR14]|nr:hypothetical protein [Bradyrhizobium sp. ERR14]